MVKEIKRAVRLTQLLGCHIEGPACSLNKCLVAAAKVQLLLAAEGLLQQPLLEVGILRLDMMQPCAAL